MLAVRRSTALKALRPSHAQAIKRDIAELIFLFPFYFFVIALAYTLVVTVNEISSRQSLFHLLDTLQREVFVARTAGASSSINADATDGGSTKTDLVNTEQKIAVLEDLKSRLITLSAVGSPDSLTENVVQTIAIQLAGFARGVSASPFQGSESKSQLSLWAQAENLVPVYRLRNDNLLAIAITCAAIIGAFTAAYRKRKINPLIDETTKSSIVGMTVEAVIIGCGSGLLSFLAIKGGKSVFFLELNGAVAAVNPYSGAFTGFLAGLFTEKLFVLLSELVDYLGERLRAVTKDGHGNERPRHDPTNLASKANGSTTPQPRSQTGASAVRHEAEPRVRR